MTSETQSQVSNFQVRSLWLSFMPHIGNFEDKRNQMVGADGVAMSVIYMIPMYHRMFPIVGALALADLTYYVHMDLEHQLVPHSLSILFCELRNLII